MDGGGHVNVKPHSGIVESQIGANEKTGTGGKGVAPIGHRIFHVGYSRREFGKVQLKYRVTLQGP